MIDHFRSIFDLVIEADNNPFKIQSKQVYKKNGEIKTNILSETIDLNHTDDLIDDIIKRSETVLVDFYPKGIIQKLFKKRNLNSLKDLNTDFILINPKTKEKLSKHGIKIENEYSLDIEDFLIVGTRGRLVYRKTENGIEVNYDKKLFKVFKLI
jgi:hypothetical protein